MNIHSKYLPRYSLLAALIWTGATLLYAPDFLRGFFLYGIYASLVLFCLFVLPRYDTHQNFYYTVISLAALIVAMHVIGQYIAVIPFEYRQLYGSRTTGPFTNPNHMSAFIAPCLSLVFIMIVKSSRSMLSVFVSMVFLIGYAALVISGTRGAWIGFLSGMAIIFVFLMAWHGDRLKTKIPDLTILLISCAIITFLIFSPNRYRSHNETPPDKRLKAARELMDPASAQDYSIKERAFIWHITYTIIKSNPIMGTGFSSYPVAFKKYANCLRSADSNFNKTFPLNYFSRDHRFAHNEFLHLWSESGLPGLILYLFSLIFILIRTLQKHILKSDITFVSLFASVVIILVHSLVDYPLHLIASGFVFWASIGFLVRKLESIL